jgi:hypothetical protein
MDSGQGHGRRRLAPVTLLVALAGCPQLMDDDFAFVDRVQPEGSLPDGGVLPDASSDPTQPVSDAGPDLPWPEEPDAQVEHQSDAGAPDGSALVDASASGDAAAPADDGGPVLDPTAQALHDSLVHRWRFDLDAPLVDSVGGADATNVGVTFSAGAAVFAGAAGGQYLDLPNDLLSGLSNVSIEAWVIWDVTDATGPGSDWQRIFDFGSNSGGEGAQGSNANGIYLSPKSGGPTGRLHLEYRNGGNPNVDGPSPLPKAVLVQLVAVFDHDGSFLYLYQDGGLAGGLTAALDLSTIVYENNWLGRSQYTGNAPFKGRIFDFRIYSAALTKPLIEASHAAGADADW